MYAIDISSSKPICMIRKFLLVCLFIYIYVYTYADIHRFEQMYNRWVWKLNYIFNIYMYAYGCILICILKDYIHIRIHTYKHKYTHHYISKYNGNLQLQVKLSNNKPKYPINILVCVKLNSELRTSRFLKPKTVFLNND